jgi:tetratricopeptide (TPR) repeat protein
MIESLKANIQKKGLLSFQSVWSKVINESSELSSKNIKVLIEKDAFEEAYECLLNKVKTDKSGQSKTNNNIVWHLALCSYEMGRLEEALEYIDLIIKSNDETPKMWALKANIYLKKIKKMMRFNVK